MKYLQKFENYNFIEVKELINSLSDLCLELSDNNIEYEIYPSNDILIKILTFDYKNLLDKDTKVKIPDFFLSIYVEKKLKNDTTYKDWFIDFLYKLEGMMELYKFECLYSVRYIGGDIMNLDSLEELLELDDLIMHIIINFKIKK
jgi:hypothetical protein